MKKLFILSFAMLFVYQINAQTFSSGNNLSYNSFSLSAILKGLFPQRQMGFNSQSGPYYYMTSKYKEDDVIKSVLDLILKGVRTDSLKIIGFKKPSEESIGEFGRLVSVKEYGDGITLIKYCEEINCYSIRMIFMEHKIKFQVINNK